MSLLSILAASATPIVIDPPPDPDPDPSTGWPTTTDPTLLALRPTGVRELATLTATPGQSAGAGASALEDAVEPLFETPYGRFGPDHSAVLFLPPGEYEGGFGTGQWLAIVGTTGDPADVIIYSDTTAADGVVHPYAPLYMEGVTLKGSYNATVQQSPKYAAHIGGSPRTTFANVIFDVTDAQITSAADPTWGNAGTVGMDGGPGNVVTFYGCEFYDVTGQSRLGMNLHGGGASTLGLKVSFIDCIAPKGVGFAHGQAGGANDKMYVIGGTIGGTIQGDTGVEVYTNLANTVTGSTIVVRDHTDWPLPDTDAHGLIAPWDTYFYPSALETPGTTYSRVTVGDAAAMTPVTGRIYVSAVPITQGMYVNRFGYTTVSGAGQNYKRALAPSIPVSAGSLILTDDRGQGAPPNLVNPLPSGEWLAPNDGAAYIMYPAVDVGGNQAWVAIQFPDATGVQLLGSASYPGLHPCWISDDSGATFTQVSAGTPFPLPHIAQVR